MKIALASDWKKILTKAWSARFMALGLVFMVAEQIVPTYDGYIDVQTYRYLYAISLVGAFISRFVMQKDFEDGK